MHKILKLGTLLLICICMVTTPAVMGCGSASEKISEQIAEKAIESEGGEDVDVDIDADKGEINISSSEGSFNMKTSGEAEWPDEVPSYVPKFDGKIISVVETESEGQKHFSIIYEDLDNLDMDDYADDLESNGWDVVSRLETGDVWMVQASRGDNDDEFINATVNTDEDSGSIMYVAQ
jgi:hypothetical protein